MPLLLFHLVSSREGLPSPSFLSSQKAVQTSVFSQPIQIMLLHKHSCLCYWQLRVEGGHL